jgi:uncharacterized protein (DUF433 family)
MFKKNKIWKVFAGLLVLAVALGASAFAIPTLASEVSDGLAHMGFPGRPGKGGDQTYLADALGITVEELEAAQQAASEKALDLAVVEGLLTQEEADAMKTLGMGWRGKGFAKRGEAQVESAIDPDALLADELGISAEDLQAARQESAEAAMQDAIENGDLTQEQVDMMEARQALKDYQVDRDSVLEDLGISAEDLQAAREEGLRMDEILEQYGLTIEDVQAAMQAAHEEAIQAALDDGAITQEQADLLLSQDFGKGPGGRDGQGCPGGRGGKGGRGGFERPEGFEGGPGHFSPPSEPSSEL